MDSMKSDVATVSGDVMKIKASQKAFAAILKDGGRDLQMLTYDSTVVCWGDAKSGGDCRAVQSRLQGVQKIRASGAAFAALLQNGDVVTWGSSVADQLHHIQQIKSSGDAFVAVRDDAQLICWGNPRFGGDGPCCENLHFALPCFPDQERSGMACGAPSERSAALVSKVPRSVGNCQSAADIFRRSLETSSENSAQIHLDLADALNCVMRIQTNGNMLLISGTQDTPGNIRIWKKVGPEAWDHANEALKSMPRSARAASVYADAFQYMSSAHGILRQALTGGGQEFLRNARRMQKLGPQEEGGLGFIFEGCFYLAAPWPVRDPWTALHLMQKALAVKKSKRNFYYMGLAHYHLEHWDEALSFFSKARQASPEFLSEYDFAEGLNKEASHGIDLCKKKLAKLDFDFSESAAGDALRCSALLHPADGAPPAAANAVGVNGRSALHLASANGSLGAVKALLQAHAMPDSCNAEGLTPLHLSAVHGFASVAKALLSARADANVTCQDGRLPLHLVCISLILGVMALAEGTRVYVCYDLPPPEPELYHERYVLAVCACGQGYHVILTPDFETYAEQISLENADISGFRIGVGGRLPAGLTAANTYQFRNMPDPEMMMQLRRDAAQGAAAMQVVPGGGAGVAPAVAAPVVQMAPAAPDEVWVRIETDGVALRGEEVRLDGSEVLHGDVGLKSDGVKHYAICRMKRDDIEKYKGSEASADARLLGVAFQGVNRAERQWRDVSKEIHQESFDDWAVPGPRTSEWCVRFLNRRNVGPSDHHRWWTQNHSLKSDAWGVAEHDTLMKVVDKLGRYDGLDLSNLAGAELAFRRLQLIEFVYSERGPGGGKGASKADKKGDAMTSMQQYEATIFSGGHKELGDCMVAPALLDYVAKEVEGEAAVLKQVRKAREERFILFFDQGIFLAFETGGAVGDEAAGLSRSVQRRLQSQHHVDIWHRDIVQTLNAMFMGDEAMGNFDGGGRQTLSQRICLEKLRQAILDAGKPPEGIDGREALAELQAKPGYGGDPANLAPMSLDLISLPPPHSKAATLEMIFGEEARNFKHRLMSKVSADAAVKQRKDESELKAPYVDPLLRSSPRVYADFCRLLHGARAG
eukprot:s48_g21.t1